MLYVHVQRRSIPGSRPSWQDVSANVSVSSSVGIDELRQACVSAILPKWHQWARGYEFPAEGVTIEHKGTPVSGDSDCILQYFTKKSRAGTIGPKTYNFHTVPDLTLLIEKKFYDKVIEYLVESDGLVTGARKVGGSSM
jgi:hypothetical protein